MPVTTIEWSDNKIRMIDQTRLPEELIHLEINDTEVLAEAIKSLRIRGAPAIGIAGAFGVVLGMQNFAGEDKELFFKQLSLRIKNPTLVLCFNVLARVYVASLNNFVEKSAINSLYSSLFSISSSVQ